MVEPLFIKTDLVAASFVELAGDEAKHAITVRRMRVGEAIAVSDGRGLRVRGTVSAIEKNSLTVAVSEVIEEELPKLRFVLVQALAKGDRDELAIQAATELGVSEIIPWQASRSVSRWEGKKLDSGVQRWQQIVSEAAKQSLRSFIPEVKPALTTAELIAELKSFELVLVLDPTGKQNLVAVKLPESGKVAIVVGPEGGIAAEELTVLGGEIVSLGANVLRTSTAGPAVLAALTLR